MSNLTDSCIEIMLKKIKNKKILIYGTGIKARKLIQMLNKYNVTFVADCNQISGQFEGIPVIDFDCTEMINADVVIIACAQKNTKEIYRRVIDRCLAFGWQIYSSNGSNLIDYYRTDLCLTDDKGYYCRNEKELLDLINQYDAISFDLFDTLIMREVLKPTDVIRIVDNRIREKGIYIDGFFEKRIEAEKESHGKSIYDIYLNFERIASISHQQSDVIMNEEIQCEQDCIIPRKKMLEVMKQAAIEGKEISIISDMYLPRKVMDPILKELGIVGYHNIYISCDYGGIGKSDGLFEIYLKDIGEKRCLHIGDNKITDEMAAQKVGIDTYLIKSAYDLLVMSNLRSMLSYSHTNADKAVIGSIVGCVFNDPFCLSETQGTVKISDYGMMGRIIIMPLIVTYITSLISMSDIYSYILFTARDGYILKNVYDRIDAKFFPNGKPADVYLYGSRRLNLKVIASQLDDTSFLERYIVDNTEAVLSDFLGVEGVPPKKEDETVTQYYLSLKNQIHGYTLQAKKNYANYLCNQGITPITKCLICDTVAQGTTQYSLNLLGYNNIDGLYLYKVHGKHDYSLPITSIFSGQECSILLKDPFLETIFTAPHPTIISIDDSGMPIYGKDSRSKTEKKMISEIQKGAVESAVKLLNNFYFKGKVNPELAEYCFRISDEVEYSGECLDVSQMYSVDDGQKIMWV